MRQCNVQTLHVLPAPPTISVEIKYKGIDKRVGNDVVYKSYMSHFQPVLDMPLDLISMDIRIHWRPTQMHVLDQI